MRPAVRAAIKRTVAALGYQVQGIRHVPRQLLDPRYLRVIEFDDILCRRMFDVGPELNFVQIGAFDGVVGDPLQKYIARCGWRGILVEPQPHAVERLRSLYADNSRISILPAALDHHAKIRTLYTLDLGKTPEWAGGLASFDRQNILKHAGLIPGLERMIREVRVPCVSFGAVLQALPARLDLLQIDTEGYDAEILSMFPFDRVRPAIVHWEVKHLTKHQREKCLDRLDGFGYRFASSGGEDMLAVNF
jgi:FkbM family methyltransferase